MSLSEARKLENKLKRQKGGLGLEILTHLKGSSSSTAVPQLRDYEPDELRGADNF